MQPRIAEYESKSNHGDDNSREGDRSCTRGEQFVGMKRGPEDRPQAPNRAYDERENAAQHHHDIQDQKHRRALQAASDRLEEAGVDCAGHIQRNLSGKASLGEVIARAF